MKVVALVVEDEEEPGRIGVVVAVSVTAVRRRVACIDISGWDGDNQGKKRGIGG